MATVTAQFGHLDVLVLNAQFDAITRVNLKGVFFTLQKALPLLGRGSSVIVTTSISNQSGAPNFSVYAACKAALRSFVQSLSLELVGRGIRVNAISPGPIDTPGFGRWGLPQEAVDAIRADFERRSPMQRFGRPVEVARLALFLAGDEASYCVGAEMVVDGGFSLQL
jgi:NAD(P)-dependent dehydrogenase (short-subunit alcohol dehydrogenase family)